ncbi:MAG: prepilin-type N-terminal cleavage/methylation domain-containing protein [Parcubacteria group bacterium]|nr:prepilin-type N-terminal cleavage/methylation domain-containing protein [Parcubacteria group bacterium]
MFTKNSKKSVNIRVGAFVLPKPQAKARYSSAGFTLVELLVVIAIIGVLSSVVLVSLNSARTKARDAKRVADIANVRIALEGYYDANNNYPTTLAGLSPTYLSAVPKDPQDGSSYSYAALGSGASCQSYHLGDTLENAGHVGLQNDADATAGTVCTGGGTDFAGTDPMYDVKP